MTATIVEHIPFHAVVLEVRRIGATPGEKDVFQTDGCVIMLTSAVNPETTAGLTLWVDSYPSFNSPGLIDAVLSDGVRYELLLEGKVTERGEPRVFAQLRTLCEKVLTGKLAEDTNTPFSAYAGTARFPQ